MEIILYSFGRVPLLSLAGDFDHNSVSSCTEGADKALVKDGHQLGRCWVTHAKGVAQMASGWLKGGCAHAFFELSKSGQRLRPRSA
jgi:hypothetical protein